LPVLATKGPIWDLPELEKPQRSLDWLATKKPEIASTSLAFYQNRLGKFLEFLGPKAEAPMRDVTKADIIAFRNRLLTQVSAKTANHDLRAVKTLFKSYLVKGEIRLTTRKTDKVMILPIATPLRRYLEPLPSSDDVNTPLHPRAFEVVARQGKSGGLSRQFIDLLAQAGIREKQTHQSRGIGRSSQRQAGALSFHSLRRTATTLLRETGVPAAVVQSLIGHDSEEVHQLYVAVGKDALASAAARLPDLG